MNVPLVFLDEARMSKKMIKIKKKLVSLEMERCQKKIEHKDLTRLIKRSKNKSNSLRTVVTNDQEDKGWRFLYTPLSFP